MRRCRIVMFYSVEILASAIARRCFAISPTSMQRASCGASMSAIMYGGSRSAIRARIDTPTSCASSVGPSRVSRMWCCPGAERGFHAR